MGLLDRNIKLLCFYILKSKYAYAQTELMMNITLCLHINEKVKALSRSHASDDRYDYIRFKNAIAFCVGFADSTAIVLFYVACYTNK